MSKVRPGLGRGLESLLNPQTFQRTEDGSLVAVEKTIQAAEADSEKIIGDSARASDDSHRNGHSDSITKLPIDRIFPNPFQPRTDFDPVALEELQKSILANGLIQPITVRKMPDGSFQLISGERRWRACSALGHQAIPAYILDVASDELMLAMALIENIQREQLNPIEVAHAYKRLMNDCNLTQEQIAERVGKDRSTITNSIRLLKLPEQVQIALVQDKISMGHARAIINLPDTRVQLSVLEKIITEGLTVRNVEQIAKKALMQDKKHTHANPSKTDQNKDYYKSSLEDRFRKIFGTKILLKQKQNGAGEIIIEFFSPDELERLIELIDIIEKYNN